MLQAKTKSGTHVTLASLSTNEIARMRHIAFFCPMCHEEVVVRAGMQIIPHFAHKPRSNCPYSEGGESSYHEKGKFLLYQWLKKQGLQATLEHYLPQLQQRPDIYIEVLNKRIAIEYQCSKIPIRTINRRIEGYIRAGITPIWVLSAKLFKRKGKHRLKIDRFLHHFIHRFSTETAPVLYFFCPNTLQFTRFSHIYYTQPNQALGQLTISPLEKVTFPDLFIHPLYAKLRLYQDWKNEKNFFRLRQKAPLYGKELDWYQWLYKKRTYKEHLPSLIYIPVQGAQVMKTPLWDWQSRICLDLIQPLAVGDVFSQRSCHHLLTHYITPSHFYPLIHQPINPITDYLNMLVQEGSLQRMDRHHYKKTKPLYFYSTLEQAIEGDERLMNELGKM